MKRHLLAALILPMIASPALALTARPELPAKVVAPVDRLYPEMADEGDAWRSLLPIMLLDVAINRSPAATAEERSVAQTR